MPTGPGAGYNSLSQRVRVISESWAEHNLYCPACPCDLLDRLPPNTRAVDFRCGDCGSSYQLKCARRQFGSRLLDGAYAAMVEAIESGSKPSLLMLQYNLGDWCVENLTVVPSFAFPPSCIERRAPLSPAARRAGYVGCNILLTRIPADARIAMVSEGTVEMPAKVRRKFRRLRPMARLSSAQRGWTLDVLNVVRSLGRQQFALGEVLGHAEELRRLHPDNRHVGEKVRQQLQRLRDLGFLEFLDNKGTYRLKASQ